MPTLPVYQVDAFTDRPFSGNPAAVCPLQAPLPAPLMQDIAAENNLSETAFFERRADGDFDLRWFTPTVEVDLCGHATLASAFVLMTELEPARRDATFHTRSGPLRVAREGDLFVMDFPSYRPAPAAPDVAAGAAAALGVRPVEVLRARSVLVVLDTAADVRRVAPDMAAVARLAGGWVCVTAPGAGDPDGDVDFVSRFFAPGSGIPEDPVTGSTHCMLTPYWAARLGRSTLTARQVSRRGGELRCEAAGDDRVRIGGRAVLVLTGELRY